jgi:hypothetical protein
VLHVAVKRLPYWKVLPGTHPLDGPVSQLPGNENGPAERYDVLAVRFHDGVAAVVKRRVGSRSGTRRSQRQPQ